MCPVPDTIEGLPSSSVGLRGPPAHNAIGNISRNMFRGTYSGTMTLGTPPKNSNILTCAPIHDCRVLKAGLRTHHLSRFWSVCAEIHAPEGRLAERAVRSAPYLCAAACLLISRLLFQVFLRTNKTVSRSQPSARPRVQASLGLSCTNPGTCCRASRAHDLLRSYML